MNYNPQSIYEWKPGLVEKLTSMSQEMLTNCIFISTIFFPYFLKETNGVGNLLNLLQVFNIYQHIIYFEKLLRRKLQKHSHSAE